MLLFLQALLSGTLTGGVYALAGIGMSLVFGVMNISNFAHGDLMMLGMYLAYFAFTLLHIDPYVSLVMIMPIAFLFGFLMEKVFINRVIHHPHQNQILLTIGLGLIMSNTALLAFTSDPKILTTSYSSSAFNLPGGIFLCSPGDLLSHYLRDYGNPLPVSFKNQYWHGAAGNKPEQGSCPVNGY
jgi:branched-chain amino acid transport system permease protein